MKIHLIASVLPLVFVAYANGATVTVDAFSTLWTPMIGNYDYLGDQQSAVSGDIVGVNTDYGLLMTFNNSGSTSNTDGTIGFRIRLDVAGGTTANPAFDRAAFIGIDADLNGSVDVFIGINYSGSKTDLGIYAPGATANTSPSTTSISVTPYKPVYSITAANVNYRPVDFGSTKDGGSTNDVTPNAPTATKTDPDYYISFMVPFNDVVGFLATKSINITDQTSLRYISGTSTQANSINQDLGGVNGNLTSSSTWVALGGFTQVVNSSGTVVPEANTSLFALAGLSLLLSRRKRTAF